MSGVFAGVVRHGADGGHQGIQVRRLATTETLQQRCAAQAEQGIADRAVGGRQQQAATVLEQLHQNAAGTDHQREAEIVFALDADNQLSQWRLGHGFEQQLIEHDARGVSGNAGAHLLQCSAQCRAVLEVQRHGTGLGLVWQLSADRFEYQRIAQGFCCLQGLVRRAQYAVGRRQAKGF
ncbi:hypothetical protein D3C72_1010880 [compost metagenome]